MLQPMYFYGQHKNEKLVFYIYKHWVSFLRKVKGPLIFFIITIIFFVSWISLAKEEGVHTLTFLKEQVVISLFFYSLFLLHIHTFFIQTFHYIFNILMVTDFRFIEVRQTLFFENNRESIDLEKIQDVQSHKNGFFENIFDYGSIYLTFSDLHDPKIIRNIPDPLRFIELINSLKRRLIYKHEQLEEGDVAISIHHQHDGDDSNKEIII